MTVVGSSATLCPAEHPYSVTRTCGTADYLNPPVIHKTQLQSSKTCTGSITFYLICKIKEKEEKEILANLVYDLSMLENIIIFGRSIGYCILLTTLGHQG